MTPNDLKDILIRVSEGDLSPAVAADDLLSRQSESLGFATLDHDRAVRCGVPEVIYAAGKTPDQVVQIARTLTQRNGFALITRCEKDHQAAVCDAFEQVTCGDHARTILVGSPPDATGRAIPIVSAGTSDGFVAEEAELTCKSMGQRTVRINDIGVAGLHRLLNRIDEIRQADVVICIAGMEGALPSVLGGLVAAPVIAVPTSVGYGASLNGIAALLGMLNSCAAGVTVVNIDNGFGAAYSATLIQRSIDQSGKDPT